MQDMSRYQSTLFFSFNLHNPERRIHMDSILLMEINGVAIYSLYNNPYLTVTHFYHPDFYYICFHSSCRLKIFHITKFTLPIFQQILHAFSLNKSNILPVKTLKMKLDILDGINVLLCIFSFFTEGVEHRACSG